MLFINVSMYYTEEEIRNKVNKHRKMLIFFIGLFFLIFCGFAVLLILYYVDFNYTFNDCNFSASCSNQNNCKCDNITIESTIILQDKDGECFKSYNDFCMTFMDYFKRYAKNNRNTSYILWLNFIIFFINSFIIIKRRKQELTLLELQYDIIKRNNILEVVLNPQDHVRESSQIFECNICYNEKETGSNIYKCTNDKCTIKMCDNCLKGLVYNKCPTCQTVIN